MSQNRKPCPGYGCTLWGYAQKGRRVLARVIQRSPQRPASKIANSLNLVCVRWVSHGVILEGGLQGAPGNLSPFGANEKATSFWSEGEIVLRTHPCLHARCSGSNFNMLATGSVV